MRLFDFFRTITTKFKNRDLLRVPEAQYINSANVENSIIHENAYINAYTKQFKTKPSDIIKVEENGKILKMRQNDSTLELRRIKRLKESLPVEDGRQIDLYSGILEKNEKKNLVYFGLENELNLKRALEDKNKSYKVSNKMTKLFTIPQTNLDSKFVGSLVEDDIYNNYCITKSNRLENYVNKIEERRVRIMQAQKQGLQNKTQAKKSAGNKKSSSIESKQKNTTQKTSNMEKNTKKSASVKASSKKTAESVSKNMSKTKK